MDVKQSSDTSAASYFDDSSEDFMSSDPFSQIDSHHPQKWGDHDYLNLEAQNPGPYRRPSSISFDNKQQIKDQFFGSQVDESIQNWDPSLMLDNLSFLEQRIHQLRDMIHSIVKRQGQVLDPSYDLIVHQQLAAADFTSLIIQLISTAGALLPSAKSGLPVSDSSLDQLGNLPGTNPSAALDVGSQPNQNAIPETGHICDTNKDKTRVTVPSCLDESKLDPSDEQDVKDIDEATDGEHLPPGSYEVLQLEKEEILAPHTHFCSICGKGFKRDANLRMHMRGHGDEYKTPSALSKPHRDSEDPLPIKRYSCPFVGCKRNKDHKKFQPLKTILCVKNHYKRSHCDKSYTCSRCNSKKFSVLADLKTHEKHCGRDKWLCSCGTTFSRKDKLFGHVALFQGHSPVVPMEETQASAAPEHVKISDGRGSFGKDNGYGLGSNVANDIQMINFKGDDESEYFSGISFSATNFGGFQQFPQS